MPVAFVIAAAIAAFGYLRQYRSLQMIMPINYYGCLRYAQSVDETRRWPGYEYSATELQARALPPFASIITVMLGLLLSLWIGWSVGFWMPFIVTALMFTASAFPVGTWGPLLTSGLEIIYSGGLYYALLLLAGQL